MAASNLTAPPPTPVPCPICGQTDCSLLHVRDRLVPVYNAVVVPVVNTLIQAVARLGFIAAGILVFAILMGWTR